MPMQNNETPACKDQALFEARVLIRSQGLEQTLFERAKEVADPGEKTRILRGLITVSRTVNRLVKRKKD